MNEAEVQPLVAFVSGSGQVMLALFLGHGIPLRRTFLIDVDVEEFRGYHEDDVVEGYRE